MSTALATRRKPQHEAKVFAAEESPSSYADRIGQTYADERTDEHRKSHGLYLTPPALAAFMASMIGERESVRLLDPSAGAGILICAAVEAMISRSQPPRHVEVVAYEIDSDLAVHLRETLNYLAKWAAKRGTTLRVVVRVEDFILASAHSLETQRPGTYDVVIANPPYFKIGKDDPRAIAAQAVVHGQPNIYSLFMAVSAAMLTVGGDLVFITPRSFASGPYFKRFRQQFFSLMRPIRTHVFDSRKDAFRRDEVLQENIILHALREDGWSESAKKYRIVISSSAGANDLSATNVWSTGLSTVIARAHLSGGFRLPALPCDADILEKVESWENRLSDYGFEVSTGPVVPFRATEFLATHANGVTVPLLWMNHVRAMEVQWPVKARKPQWIDHKPDSRKLLVPSANYVLLRRFSAKEEDRRLVAAPLLADQLDGNLWGLENHLNYVHRPGGSMTEDEVFGLAALYNSTLLDGYFRCINGNTQVGATELRAMPVPSLAAIRKLGRQVRDDPSNTEIIDSLVAKLVKDTTSKQKGSSRE